MFEYKYSEDVYMLNKRECVLTVTSVIGLQLFFFLIIKIGILFIDTNIENRNVIHAKKIFVVYGTSTGNN